MLNTSELCDASYELSQRLESITDTFIDHLTEVNIRLGNRVNPRILRRSIEPKHINPKLRLGWAKNELWVGRLLQSTESFPREWVNNPYLNVPKSRIGYDEVVEFWEREYSLAKLLSRVNPNSNPQQHGQRTYSVSRRVRLALWEGIYIPEAA